MISLLVCHLLNILLFLLSFFCPSGSSPDSTAFSAAPRLPSPPLSARAGRRSSVPLCSTNHPAYASMYADCTSWTGECFESSRIMRSTNETFIILEVRISVERLKVIVFCFRVFILDSLYEMKTDILIFGCSSQASGLHLRVSLKTSRSCFVWADMDSSLQEDGNVLQTNQTGGINSFGNTARPEDDKHQHSLELKVTYLQVGGRIGRGSTCDAGGCIPVCEHADVISCSSVCDLTRSSKPNLNQMHQPGFSFSSHIIKATNYQDLEACPLVVIASRWGPIPPPHTSDIKHHLHFMSLNCFCYGPLPTNPPILCLSPCTPLPLKELW